MIYPFNYEHVREKATSKYRKSEIMLPHCFSSKLMPRMFSRAYSATTHINYYDKYANAMIKSLPIAANSQKVHWLDLQFSQP